MMLLIYGITFLLEAFIALQYFEWVFDNAKYAIGKRFAYILLAYSVLFGIFQMKILVLNMVAFPIKLNNPFAFFLFSFVLFFITFLPLSCIGFV